MWEVDTAIDDYVHQIVRTRPWTKKREEELLEDFCDWLFSQPGVDPHLNALTPAMSARYADAVDLHEADRDELATTLFNLMAWAEHKQLVTANPFEAVPLTATRA